MIRFTRDRNTKDKQDVAFTDTEPMYMIFPVKGGTYNGVNKKIRKHEVTPTASSERIFIRSCRTGITVQHRVSKSKYQRSSFILSDYARGQNVIHFSTWILKLSIFAT
jgi:hypothetical protein